LATSLTSASRNFTATSKPISQIRNRKKLVNSHVFTLLVQNVQYLKSKINEIEIFLSESQPSLACFTELALSSSEVDALYIPGYKVLTTFVREKNRHKQSGGVGIFLKTMNDFDCTVIDVSNFCADKILEAAAVKISANNFSLIVLTVYRSPKHANEYVSEFLDRLNDLLSTVLNIENNFLLCGDLNIDLLKETHSQREYLKLMNSFGY